MPVGWTIGFIGSPSTTSATSSTSVTVSLVFSANYVDTDQSDNNTSVYTFSGVNFGTASANRIVVVSFHGISVSSPQASGVSIGGVAATIIRNINTADVTTGICQALVPTGTTGTVQVRWPETMESCAIGVWRIYTNNQAAQHSGQSSAGASIAATVPTNGFGIAAYSTGVGGTTAVTPSGFTERYDFNVDTAGDGADMRCCGGDFTASATIDVTGGNGDDEALVYASWGP